MPACAGERFCRTALSAGAPSSPASPLASFPAPSPAPSHPPSPAPSPAEARSPPGRGDRASRERDVQPLLLALRQHDLVVERLVRVRGARVRVRARGSGGLGRDAAAQLPKVYGKVCTVLNSYNTLITLCAEVLFLFAAARPRPRCVHPTPEDQTTDSSAWAVAK